MEQRGRESFEMLKMVVVRKHYPVHANEQGLSNLCLCVCVCVCVCAK